MDIDIEKAISMSCCPVILPEGRTIPVFKKHKSKWESNMELEDKDYLLGHDVFYLSHNNKSVAITVCIDALKASIDSRKARLIITPAASPSTGEFRNKFLSYLSQDIPSIFCNSFENGGSTIFCHAPKEQNLLYANTNCITEMAKCEEAIVIADIDIMDHSQKRKSVSVRELIKVISVLPIIYLDNSGEISLREKILQATMNKDRSMLISLSEMLRRSDPGITSELNAYLHDGICNGSKSFERIANQINYIGVNDFSLLQYQANWVEKALKIINDSLLEGKIKASENLFSIQQRLYNVNE
jgi:hypothetical protein